MAYSAAAMRLAAKKPKPSTDDLLALGKGMKQAKQYVQTPIDMNGTGQRIPAGSKAVLEPNKKAPTGWEPVVTMPGDMPSPKGSRVIATTKKRK